MPDTAVLTKRAPTLEWVPIEKMQMTEEAQRKLRHDHPVLDAARSGNFDLEAIGYPVLNHRDGAYFIVDGQHRIEGLKLIGWGDQQVQCEVYDGLTIAQEAELFLARDNRRAISPIEKHKIAVTAGRAEDVRIANVCAQLNLQIAQYPGQKGSIHAVGTLRRVLKRGDDYTLASSLGIIRDAFGTPGLSSAVIDGMALVVQRYKGKLDGNRLVTRLQSLHGGVNGLTNRAAVLQKQTGNQVSHCVAAVIVQVYNQGPGGVRGGRLTDWWRPEGA